MKPFKLTLTGTGHCGDDHPNAIESRVQTLLKQLSGNGHSDLAATLVVDGQTVELSLNGGLVPLVLEAALTGGSTGGQAASEGITEKREGPTLESIAGQLTELTRLLTSAVPPEKPKRSAKQPKPVEPPQVPAEEADKEAGAGDAEGQQSSAPAGDGDAAGNASADEIQA